MSRTTKPEAAVTEQEREQFAKQGYFVREGVLGVEDVAELRREAAAILELVLNSSLLLKKRNPRLDAHLLDGGRALVRKVQPVNDLSLTVASFSSDSRLVGPMSELMGDEPMLMEEKLNYKQLVDLCGQEVDLEPKRQTEEVANVAWQLHHDWGYYRYNGYPQTTMSSAIALDDCEGRGPIRVVPGSHLLDVELAEPNSGSGVVARGALGPHPDLVPLNMTAGSVAFFHSMLVHDSEPNRTGEPRRMMIYSHYPRSHQPAEDPDRRNRPTRDKAGPIEAEYRKMIAAGARPLVPVREG
ncbi:MAG TPA: phytanoyl-CoA dioxygenase family protein [Acidimicrobiales bacterium]|nr:phytanoyl-CoA dioxygenase family protein [Acidimicrobiales bacterium]